MVEHEFLRDAADRFLQLLDQDVACAAVIVAAPTALAVQRQALAKRWARIVAEIAKDLTKNRMSDIEAMMAR